VIAKPAAWRLELAPPPEPAVADARAEHAHLISAGLPREHESVDVRFVDGGARGRWERARVHEHDVPEVIVVLPTTTLTCEVVLGDERYDVEGPARIVVPAGLPHSVNVKAGSGFVISAPQGAR
jgi:hypothetical protein